jgi:predicted NBD/HSP70 family sugar kinase
MRISDQAAARLAVLKAIRRAEPVSRTELVGLANLPMTTLTDITAELVARGVITEERSAAIGPGRPRQHLRINPDAAYGVGAFLLHDRSLQVEVINARGDKLFSDRAWPEGRSLDDLAEQIAAVLDATIAASPVRKRSISKVGVAMHGTLDAVGGVVHWLHTFPPRPVAFASIIEERLGLPVTVDNVVNVMARAEHWFGDDPELDDFVLVHAGMGLGLSQYMEGALRVGAHGMASEFAHIKMTAEAGPACICGAQGCLATHATIYGIVMRVCGASGRSPPPVERFQDVFDEIAHDARMGEPMSRAAFDGAGHQLGVAVGNVVNLLDPARVLVLALDPNMADLIVAPFHAAVQQAVLPSLRGRTRIQFRGAEEVRFAHGAAALVLEELYTGETAAKRASAAPASRASSDRTRTSPARTLRK